MNSETSPSLRLHFNISAMRFYNIINCLHHACLPDRQGLALIYFTLIFLSVKSCNPSNP